MGIRKGGFTLIELVISIAVLGFLVTAATGLFFRSFRGGEKTDMMVVVEQESNLVMGIFERMIRNSQEVLGVDGVECPNVGSSLSLLGWDSGETVLNLSGNQIASNSALITSEEVMVENLEFECIRGAGAPDQIIISFDMGLINQAGEVENVNHYEKTVGLRNY